MHKLTPKLMSQFSLTILACRKTAIMATSSSSSCSPAATTTTKYQSGIHSVAFVTTPDETVAKTLARAIVSKKLAACVNIVPKITSIYEWDGKLNEDDEVLLMIKTQTDKIDELSKYVRENHPYEVAEVISLPIDNGNPPYLDWLTKSMN